VARAEVAQPTEGEVWARELLDRLREDSFTGPAWQQFFADALERSRHIRARRPALTSQSRRWGAIGLVAALPAGPAAAAWWTLWWAMIDWHLGMAETPDGDPQPLRAHDALTLTRLWAAPIVRRHPHPALVAAALLTDAADGALARRAGPTRLGRDLDSTADTAFAWAAVKGAVEHKGLDPRLPQLEYARLTSASAVVFLAYFGRSRTPPPMHHRQTAAVLAAAGIVLATLDRPSPAGHLLRAAIGYRSLIRWRASRP
jgi:phosphatidylglycerophosphate synthase